MNRDAKYNWSRSHLKSVPSSDYFPTSLETKWTEPQGVRISAQSVNLRTRCSDLPLRLRWNRRRDSTGKRLSGNRLRHPIGTNPLTRCRLRKAKNLVQRCSFVSTTAAAASVLRLRPAWSSSERSCAGRNLFQLFQSHPHSTLSPSKIVPGLLVRESESDSEPKQSSARAKTLLAK